MIKRPRIWFWHQYYFWSIFLIFMSLLIVGSCSRVTQNIVKQLAHKQSYESITILDLLPLYHFHQRFYNLQRYLRSNNLSTQITLSKLFRPEDLAANIKSHKDLLFVTHDYFQSVTSKTKLMEMTANLSQSVSSILTQEKSSFCCSPVVRSLWACWSSRKLQRISAIGLQNQP